MKLNEYDTGLLSSYGGGDVDWWYDYIRAELGRAHEHYQSQVTFSVPTENMTSDNIGSGSLVRKEPVYPLERTVREPGGCAVVLIPLVSSLVLGFLFLVGGTL